MPTRLPPGGWSIFCALDGTLGIAQAPVSAGLGRRAAWEEERQVVATASKRLEEYAAQLSISVLIVLVVVATGKLAQLPT